MRRYSGTPINCRYASLDSATHVVVAMQACPSRGTCFYNIIQDAIDYVFVEDTNISVREDIFLETLQLKAMFRRFVRKVQDSEIRKAGLWTDCRKLRDLHVDSVFTVVVYVAEDFYVWRFEFADVVLF